MKKFKPRGLGIPIGNFKLGPDGKLMRDQAAMDAKLDLCARIAKKKSKRIRYGKRASANVNRTP